MHILVDKKSESGNSLRPNSELSIEVFKPYVFFVLLDYDLLSFERSVSGIGARF